MFLDHAISKKTKTHLDVSQAVPVWKDSNSVRCKFYLYKMKAIKEKAQQITGV